MLRNIILIIILNLSGKRTVNLKTFNTCSGFPVSKKGADIIYFSPLTSIGNADDFVYFHSFN